MPLKRRALAWGIAGTLSITPWLLGVGTGLLPVHLNERIGWISPPTLLDLGGYYFQIFAWLSSRHRVFEIVLLATFILALLPLLTWRHIQSRSVVWVLLMATLAPVTAFVISRFGGTSIWASRQLIVPAVFFLMLLAMGLSLHRRAFGVAAALVMLGYSASTASRGAPDFDSAGWKAVAAAIDARLPDGVVVAEEPFVINPLRFYSSKCIYYMGDPTAVTWYLSGFRTGTPDAEQLAYVCRPQYSRCSKLEKIRMTYQVLNTRQMNPVTIYYATRSH